MSAEVQTGHFAVQVPRYTFFTVLILHIKRACEHGAGGQPFDLEGECSVLWIKGWIRHCEHPARVLAVSLHHSQLILAVYVEPYRTPCASEPVIHSLEGREGPRNSLNNSEKRPLFSAGNRIPDVPLRSVVTILTGLGLGRIAQWALSQLVVIRKNCEAYSGEGQMGGTRSTHGNVREMLWVVLYGIIWLRVQSL